MGWSKAYHFSVVAGFCVRRLTLSLSLSPLPPCPRLPSPLLPPGKDAKAIFSLNIPTSFPLPWT